MRPVLVLLAGSGSRVADTARAVSAMNVPSRAAGPTRTTRWKRTVAPRASPAAVAVTAVIRPWPGLATYRERRDTLARDRRAE